MKSVKKKDIIKKIQISTDFNVIVSYLRNKKIKLPPMPLKDICPFLEQSLSISQLTSLYNFILKQRKTLIIKNESEINSKQSMESHKYGLKLLTTYFFFIGTYFSILLVIIYLYLYVKLFFSFLILTISSVLVCISILFVFPISAYLNKSKPDKLKRLFIIKAVLYVYLLIITSLYMIFSISIGFYEEILNFAWVWSLFWIEFSFVYDSHYLWEHVLSGIVSVEYVSKLHLFFFIGHFFPFTLGCFLVGYFNLVLTNTEQSLTIYSAFTLSIGMLVSLSSGIEGYEEIIKTNDQSLVNSLRQSTILSLKYRIFVIIVLIDCLIGFCFYLFFLFF